MIRFKNGILQVPLMFFISISCALLISCAHNGDWARRISWDELDFRSLPGEHEYPDAGAIVLLDEGRMEISGNIELGFSWFQRHRIVKILNRQGQRYANIAIPYSPQSVMGRVRARSISPEGKITVLSPKKIYDVTLYPDFIFYSDQRAKLFTMPAVEDGSVVEYNYRVRIPNRSLWHSWRFQEEVPVLKSKLTLLPPGEWEVDYKVYGIDLKPQVTKAPQGFKATYEWEARDLPPLKTELAMPPSKEVTARVALAPVGMKTWDDVAQWYHRLASPQIKAGRGVKELASFLTDGLQSDIDKLKRICEWVRDNVRYIAVEIGIGGFQPHSAEEVLTNKYGDCKDMSTLVCSMAREAGIEACEVLVSTWHNGKPDTSLPSPFHFNHAIAYCPSEGENGLWIDATEKGCPFGELPWYDQGVEVLVVDREGKGQVLTTPKEPADSNRSAIDWRVAVDSTGAGVVQGKTGLWGAPASEMREELLYSTPDAQRRWLESCLAQRCSGVIVDSFSVSGVYPVKDPLTVVYTFHTTAFAIRGEEGLTFRPGQIAVFDLPDYFRSQSRVHPIDFRFGMWTNLDLTVDLPDNWDVTTRWWSDSLDSEYGSAWWLHLGSEGMFRARARYVVSGKRVPSSAYQSFQRFLDGVRERDLREVVMLRNTVSVGR